jgi:hypothetical protein
MKTCSKCGVEKPATDFYANMSWCKSCSNTATYAWRARNKERWLAKNRENARHGDYRNKYGIEPEAVLAMLEAQDHKCAICGQPEVVREVLSVDHCHVTGKVRAMLCSHCNKALGGFRDSAELLDAAAAYVRKHGE